MSDPLAHIRPTPYARTRAGSLDRARNLIADAERDATLAFMAVTLARDHLTVMTAVAEPEELVCIAAAILAQAHQRLGQNGGSELSTAVADAIAALGARVQDL